MHRKDLHTSDVGGLAKVAQADCLLGLGRHGLMTCLNEDHQSDADKHRQHLKTEDPGCCNKGGLQRC